MFAGTSRAAAANRAGGVGAGGMVELHAEAMLNRLTQQAAYSFCLPSP